MSAGRWRVPYTAPGILAGHLIVTAMSREDAYTKAVAIHRKQKTFCGHDGASRMRLRISESKRVRIEYGEPELVETAQARADSDTEAFRLAGGAA